MPPFLSKRGYCDRTETEVILHSVFAPLRLKNMLTAFFSLWNITLIFLRCFKGLLWAHTHTIVGVSPPETLSNSGNQNMNRNVCKRLHQHDQTKGDSLVKSIPSYSNSDFFLLAVSCWSSTFWRWLTLSFFCSEVHWAARSSLECLTCSHEAGEVWGSVSYCPLVV